MRHHVLLCYQKICKSIHAKFLVTFLFLLIIPLLVLTQLFTSQLYTVLKENEQDSIHDKIHFASSEFDRIFSDMDRISTSLILDYHLSDILSNPSDIPSFEWFTNYKSMTSLLSLLTSTSNYKYGITVLSADCKLYQSGASYNALLKPDSPLAQYVEGGQGRPVILNRSLNQYDDNAVITFGRSVYQNGIYLGIILVEVPVDDLDELLRPFESTSTQMFVLQNNRQIVYSSAPSDNTVIPDSLKDALEENATGVTLDGSYYLLQQTPMNQMSLSVIALVTAESVFQKSTSVIARYVLGFCLVITATIVGILILTWFFTRDIKALNEEVTNFGNCTDKEISIPVRSRDEVGQLTKGVIAMSHRIHKLLSQVRENERNKRILEFNSLQAQVNPHMIYNTLNTITYLAEMQNVSNIQDISSSFAFLLRSLSNQGEFITVSQEIAYLESFIAIKKYNLLCNIETDFSVDEDAMNCPILKLILQPIVENAMIHGFSNRLSDGFLSVTIRRQEQRIMIMISDNGIGMDEEQIQRTLNGSNLKNNTFLSVGIKNIIERLNLQYGDASVFTIASAPDCGTTVHISFPIQERSTDL